VDRGAAALGVLLLWWPFSLVAIIVEEKTGPCCQQQKYNCPVLLAESSPLIQKLSTHPSTTKGGGVECANMTTAACCFFPIRKNANHLSRFVTAGKQCCAVRHTYTWVHTCWIHIIWQALIAMKSSKKQRASQSSGDGVVELNAA